MAIPKLVPQQDDNSQRLLYKIANNLRGVIDGAFGLLVRGTVEIGPSTTTTAATMSRGTKAIATAGSAEALVGASTLVNSVILTPSRTATGRFFYGSAAGSGAQTVEIPVVITAPDGKKVDLSLIYIDATVSAETVVYEAIT
jgi:Zn-dependent alcohol dehydrogenase